MRNLIIITFILTIVVALDSQSSTYVKGPALIENSTSTATSAGTTTLTKDSQTNQIFTGVTTQIVVLPDATTLPVDRYFNIINRSTGLVTIQTNGGAGLTTVLPDMQKKLTVTNIGSAAGTWDVTNIKIDVSSASNVTGILPVVNGGTALSSTPTNGQLLIGNGTNYSLSTVSATANQTTVTNGSGTISVGTAQDIATTSSPTFSNETLTGDLTLTGASFGNLQVGADLLTINSTGLVSGGIMSVNADTTKFDIAAGVGFIINSTNFAAPTKTKITFGPFTAQTVTNLATQDITYILINSSGSIIQQFNFPTPEQRRANIFLGRLNHSGRTLIKFADTIPDFLQSPRSNVYDFIDAVGPFSYEGNIITANGANLSLDKTSGKTFNRSFNYVANNQSPSNITTGPLTLAAFKYQTQSSVAASDVTVLDPTNYDVGGTITPVGGGSARTTVQRVFLFPGGVISVQYGQAFYSNLADGIAKFQNETFIVNPVNQGIAILIANVVMERTCTSLLDTTCSSIVLAPKFGGSTGAAGAATTNLQQSYNNSSQPQITLDSTILGIQFRDAATPIGSSLFAVQNNAGTTNYLNVDVNGLSTTNFAGSGTTGAVRLHNLTTAQKNALTPAAGMMVYDTTLGRFECYGTAWTACGSAKQVSSDLTLTAADTLAISTIVGAETFLVQGSVGPVTLSTTPFGVIDPVNGYTITLIGNSDANTVEIPFSDTANGIFGYSVTLGKGQTVTYEYNATLDRYVILSVSN